MAIDVLSIIKALIEGISVGYLASIPLGPIGVIIIQRTLNKGRLSGFCSGAGAASSDFLYATVAGFSLSMITDFVEENQSYLLIVGAAVLIILGTRMIAARPKRQLQKRKEKRKKSSLWQDYASTFFLTITNPLALFVFIGVFSLIGVHSSRYERLAVILGVFAGALLWWFCLTMMVGFFRKKLTIRRLFYVNRIAGIVIVVLVVISACVELIKHIF